MNTHKPQLIQTKLTVNQAKAAVAYGFKRGLLKVKQSGDWLPDDISPAMRQAIISKEASFQ